MIDDHLHTMPHERFNTLIRIVVDDRDEFLNFRKPQRSDNANFGQMTA
ncbi:hypothetical protein [Mesorhizobium camelthorni]|uniref:Uncharacterized protein n=1 Tax=Allomesorhizobium camelthorni TaxID=475069 RepID=A0A6G4WLK9_9HYPH|nr:hypothetical protein [Mesorhizobium camelthorni]